MEMNSPLDWLKSSQGQEWIHGYISADPSVTRSELSRALCQHIGWQDSRGQLKEMSCRKALCALEERQQLLLPEARKRISKRTQSWPVPVVATVRGDLSGLGCIELQIVTGGTDEGAQWNGLMDAYHPQGCGPLCGAQIRYLIVSPVHGVIGGLAVSAAAWRLSARETWLGWSDDEREQNLAGIVCNSRFLIAPSVKVKNLGSQVLSVLARRIRQDFRERYGYSPWLMETCVDESRLGTVYRAANWIEVGMTAGRGRQDTECKGGLSQKRVFLYPLCQSTLKRLCGGQNRPQSNWLQREFGGANLGDLRLNQRLMELGAAFFAQPAANIPQACGSIAKAKAAYRFFDNDRVTMDKLLEPHLKATVDRVRPETVVLAVQDTSSLDYTTHRKMKGLGPIHNRVRGPQGLMLHTTQAFRPDGLPLGMLDVKVWARDPDKYEKVRDQSLPIEQKESYKWIEPLDSLRQTANQCPETTLVVVADREADIFEFMTAAKQKELPFLVRSKTNRALMKTETETHTDEEIGKRLRDRLSVVPEAGKIDLSVPRNGDSPARQAKMSVRFAEVTLKAPKLCSHLPPLRLWVVWTQEIAGSKKAAEALHDSEAHEADELVHEPKSLEWMLLTSVPVNNLDEAEERVRWYTRRWGIEVFHRILKSGCCIEDRQLGNDDRLEACLAIDMVVAWRIHSLCYLGRATPDVPCTVAFGDSEWKAVIAFKTRQRIPEKPPSLGKMILYVAELGGFLGRKSDGHPGTETLWKGLQRMQDIAMAFNAFMELHHANLLPDKMDTVTKRPRR